MVLVRNILFVAIMSLIWGFSAALPADAARLLVSPSEEPSPFAEREFDLVGPSPPTNARLGPQGSYLTRGKLVRYEIRYVVPEAEEVYLLWALDNWQAPDKSLWPPGSTAKKQYPYCRTRKDGDAFTISLMVPEGATLDYCFNVLIPSKGIDIWDTNGAAHRDYHSKVVPDGAAVVIAPDYSAGRERASSNRRNSSQPARIILPTAAVLLLVLAGALVRRTRFRARKAGQRPKGNPPAP